MSETHPDTPTEVHFSYPSSILKNIDQQLLIIFRFDLVACRDAFWLIFSILQV